MLDDQLQADVLALVAHDRQRAVPQAAARQAGERPRQQRRIGGRLIVLQALALLVQKPSRHDGRLVHRQALLQHLLMQEALKRDCAAPCGCLIMSHEQRRCRPHARTCKAPCKGFREHVTAYWQELQ